MGLDVKGLELRRGRRLLASSLSFEIPNGNFMELSGPNGSGKSTLLRVLSGLGRLETGQLFWEGQPFDRTGDTHRSRTLYLGHSDGLKGALSGLENLSLFASFRELRHFEEPVQTALEFYGMYRFRDVPCMRLSQGQRRRIALCRLMAFPAPLWLLDEPTTALDSLGIERFMSHLSDHLARGGLAILATHQSLIERLRPTMQLRLGRAG